MNAKRILFFLLLSSCLSLAQKSASTKPGADTSYISFLIKLSDNYSDQDPDTSVQLGNRAIWLASEINNEDLLARSYYSTSYAYASLGLYDSAKKMVNRAIDIFSKEQGKNEMRIAQCYNVLSNSLNYLGDYKEAVAIAMRAIKILESSNNVPGLATAYSNIGHIYFVQNMPVEAEKNYRKALDFARSANDTRNLGMTNNNIANCYNFLGKFDSALVYYRNAQKFHIATENKSGLGTTLLNIGSVFDKMSRQDSALFYYNKSAKIFKEINNSIGTADATLNIASLQYNAENYKEALKNYFDAYAISKKSGYRSNLSFAAEWISNCYYELKDYDKSILYKDTFLLYKDSLLNEANAKSLQEIQTKYETEKKEKEIIKLNSENKIANLLLAVKEKQKLAYLFIAIFSVVFCLILLFAIKKIRGTNKLLVKQKEEILLKTEQLNQQAAEIARYQSQMNPHFIFNAVSAVNYHILENNPEAAVNQLVEFAQLMRITLDNSESDFISLEEEVNYLKKYLEFEIKYLLKQITYEIIVPENPKPSEILIPPMLVQPLVENCIKHAGLHKMKSGKILMAFSIKGSNLLQIDVSDNGEGRKDTSRSATHTSKGIKITRSRIEKLLEKNNIVVPEPYLVNDLKNKDGIPAGTQVTLFIPLITKHD